MAIYPIRTTMKTKTTYKIETVPKIDRTFEPTRCVALIRHAKDGSLAGSIYRSFRNASGAEPGGSAPTSRRSPSCAPTNRGPIS